jgi:hypothetical protein
VAVEAEAGTGDGLSAAVRAALPEAVQRVRARVAAFLAQPCAPPTA